jgi:hypothetical protein
MSNCLSVAFLASKLDEGTSIVASVVILFAPRNPIQYDPVLPMLESVVASTIDHRRWWQVP